MPFNGGQAVNGYTILIRQVDELTFTEELNYCSGASLTVINTKTCTIPISVLTALPYNLPWGESVWAKVQARNIIGDSPFSDQGNGSVILIIPDAPINLRNLARVTNAYTVGIAWEKGLNEGGTPVIDYVLSYDQGTEEAYYIILADEITELEYTVTNLDPGVYYNFKV